MPRTTTTHSVYDGSGAQDVDKIMNISYSLDGISMRKSLRIRHDHTASDIAQIAIKKFFLEDHNNDYCLMLESPKQERRIIEPFEHLFELLDDGENLVLLRVLKDASSEDNSRNFERRVRSILGKDPQARFCADCRMINPCFFSINLGITLCADCATSHIFDLQSSFVSVIRPLYFYETPVELLKILETRGNVKANRRVSRHNEQESTSLTTPIIDASPSSLRKHSIAFMRALHGGDMSTIMELLLKDYDPDCHRDQHLPPLHYCALAGDYAMVHLLLSFSADSLSLDGDGHTAYYHAINSESPEVIGLLKRRQILQAACRQATNLNDTAQSRQFLHQALMETSISVEPRAEVLETSHLQRLSLDVFRELQSRVHLQSGFPSDRRDRLRDLDGHEFRELVKFVLSEQELWEIILMEMKARKFGRTSNISTRAAVLLRQSLEGQPSRTKNATSRLHTVQTSSLQGSFDDLQKQFLEILNGKTNSLLRERISESIVKYCQYFVETPRYEPDLECERRLNQLRVSASKIKDMLETQSDLEQEIISSQRILNDVTDRLKTFL